MASCVCPTPDTPASSSENRVARGRQAESLAASYLRLRGCTIVESNYRDGPREIDLIARQGGWLIIVEVRFRRDVARGLPEESVRRSKCVHLLRAGEAYWRAHGRGLGRLRFDLITILFEEEGMRLRHHPHFLIPGQGGRGGRRSF
jgi:putative endonuclease